MGSSIDFLGVAVMALIILLASVTVAGIIYGMRLKRRRVAAEHELVERREAIDLPEAATSPAAAVADDDDDDIRAVAKPDPAAADASVSKAPSEPSTLVREARLPDVVDAPAEANTDPAPTPAKKKSKAAPKPSAEITSPSEATPVAAPTKETVASILPTTRIRAARDGGEITQLKGLGPKLAATLADMGFTRVDQIAALTPDEASALDAQLGAFQGRMARDKWIEQAKLLAAGDRAGYEAQFGKLG